MNILVNQQTHQVQEQITVAQLLQEVLLLEGKGIAVAINQSIVPRTRWDAHIILPDDNIMLINATQGG